MISHHPLRLLLAAFLATLLLTSLPARALPPEIEADRLLQDAATEMDKRSPDWDRTLKALTAAEALPVAISTNFDYHMGRALAGNKKYKAAAARLGQYLTTQGTGARHYTEALRAYTAADKIAKEQEAEYKVAMAKFLEDSASFNARKAQARAGYESCTNSLIACSRNCSNRHGGLLGSAAQEASCMSYCAERFDCEERSVDAPERPVAPE